MTENKEIYLIDGSAYIYRAYHAIAPLSNSKGLATHAVLGFINMVNRLVKESAPEYLGIAFDAKGKVFRHDLYDQYKANRPPMPEDLREQIPYIKQFVTASNITMLEQSGVEADDILATLAKNFSQKGFRVVLVSGDKDLLQLVDSNVVMFDPMKNKVMDIAAVEEKYGIKRAHLLDYFSLVGDSSDNVPGIPGVGPKTAVKLINEYESLDGLYAGVDSLKKSKMKEKIIANREAAYLSRQLIKLKKDVEVSLSLSDYSFREADSAALVEIYEELEFSSLLKGIDTTEKIPADGFVTVRSMEQFEQMLAELAKSEILVLDTETTSLNARKAQIVGISCCTSLEKAYYIPTGHINEDGSLVENQLKKEDVQQGLKPFLLAENLQIIGHNLKYDYTVLWQDWGIELSGRLGDTFIAAHLTETGGRSLKLDTLCQERGLRLTSFEEVVKGDKRENCFAYVDPEAAGIYSCEDVYATLFLWQELEALLKEKEVATLFEEVEMPIVKLLAEMEVAGICVDLNILGDLSKEFSEKLSTLQNQIFTLAGHDFNLNSPRQLGQVLFDEQGLPHGRKTKTGFSTDVKVLEKLAKKHEIPALVLRYRTLTKLLSTYVDKLSQLQDETTKRVHTSFNQAVTATGRLSSSDPNLQNIPIRTEEGSRIRQAFVPGDGLIFLSADYSQIDLRVLAHYSQDEALIKAFCGGDDIHNRTAAEIFSVSPLLVNAEMRRVAKSINFGIVYGMSSFGLSNQLDISRKEAQRFIDRYFGLYTGVQKFMGDIVEQARRDGFVTTLLGRRRTVGDIHAKNRNQREFAERMAINTPIQGTAADIIKLAMLGCRKKLAEAKLPASMLLQIHDELVFELPEKCVDQTKEVIKESMENALALDVPLVVNFEVGTSLAK